MHTMGTENIFHPWEGYVKPFQIFGNLYFVGTIPASTHLIDTGSGLIVIDPGYPQSLCYRLWVGFVSTSSTSL